MPAPTIRASPRPSSASVGNVVAKATVLAQGTLAQAGRLQLVVGYVHAGFRLILGDASAKPQAATGIVVLGDHELFHREQAPSVLPRRQLESRAIDSFLEDSRIAGDSGQVTVLHHLLQLTTSNQASTDKIQPDRLAAPA